MKFQLLVMPAIQESGRQLVTDLSGLQYANVQSLAGAITKAANSGIDFVFERIPKCVKDVTARPKIEDYPAVSKELNLPENMIRLLSIPAEQLHPDLQRVQASIEAGLAQDIEALSPEQACALKQGAPYPDLPSNAEGLLQNWQALVLLKVEQQKLSSEATSSGTSKNLDKHIQATEAAIREGFAKLPDTAFNRELAQYDQALHRHEFGVALPAQFLQLWSHHALYRYLPASTVFPVLNNFLQGKITPETIQLRLTELTDTVRNRFDIDQAVKDQSPSLFLNQFNACLETLTQPLSVMAGVGALTAASSSGIGAVLIGSALASGIQKALSERLAGHVGTPSLETSKTIGELNRLQNNCVTARMQADQLMSSLAEVVAYLKPEQGKTLSEKWSEFSTKEKVAIAKEFHKIKPQLTPENQREIESLGNDPRGDVARIERAFECRDFYFVARRH